MALRLKCRSLSISQLNRSLSTMAAAAAATRITRASPKPDSKSPLTARDKSRAALNRVVAENDPDRILQIFRATRLTPEFSLDRLAFSKAMAKLSSTQIRHLLEESMTRPDIKTENSAAHFLVLYGQAGLHKEAIKVFDKMPERGLRRTVKSLNALITACFYAGDYDEMKRVYAEFPKIYSIEPNIGTYDALIKGLCASGDSSSAFSILDEMKSKGVAPDSATFNAIMEKLCKDERFEDVERLLETMKEHNITPGITSYNIRIKSLCRVNMSKEAMALLEELEKEGIKPDILTHTHLIHGFGKEGDLEKAKWLFKRMVKAGINPNWKAYSTLVYLLCQGKDFQAAAVFCKDWIAGGSGPGFSNLKSLVEGLVEISMEDEAKEIIGMLKKEFSESSDRWTELEELLP